MVNLFVIAVTALFLFLAVIWNRQDWLNAMLKVLFYLMAVWGVYLIVTLRMFGV